METRNSKAFNNAVARRLEGIQSEALTEFMADKDIIRADGTFGDNSLDAFLDFVGIPQHSKK